MAGVWNVNLNRRMAGLVALLGAQLANMPAAEIAQATSTKFLFSQPLSLASALEIALKQNPDILRAQKDVEAAEGILIQTRAIAVPKLQLNGRYAAIDSGDVDKLRLPSGTNNAIGALFSGPSGFSIGTDQSWSSQIRLVQSLYEGGRIVSSWRMGRLT